MKNYWECSAGVILFLSLSDLALAFPLGAKYTAYGYHLSMCVSIYLGGLYWV